MQVTSLLIREEQDHDHSCPDCDHDHQHDHGHSHAALPLAQTLIGLLFVINSFAVNWLSGFFQGDSKPVSAASAMIGAMILGYPILLTAFVDLRRGLLTTNELVALAVTISFGSGHYQEAGVVAFSQAFHLVVCQVFTADQRLHEVLKETHSTQL